ncbi:hypothetical protein Dsin_006827 [Dipteronia sinensis]|uniref:Transcription repressor n=1 Tax=Dipteronia sinensis TaxID=43782 RepID=A0AAE0B0B0_9ROSI|nr:hypothetical protein Dsin_006827 [Dipteronia sinensis]
MSKTSRKKLLINTVSVSLGCSSCRKPKLAFLFHHSKPRPNKTKHSLYNNSCSSSSSISSASQNTNLTTQYDTATATTFSISPNIDDMTTPPHNYWDSQPTRPVQGFGRVGGGSLAVEKDSDDPYLDFRHSMLQMILEKEIYNKEDLKELLNCFLQLNSPYHHEIIVRAFTEIWNGLFSVNTGIASSKLRFGCKSREF